MSRGEAESKVTGCGIATGLDIGKGFILFSLLKKKIKTTRKNHHRDNEKMERSTDKGRETLLSRGLGLQSYVHYKIFSALLYVENANVPMQLSRAELGCLFGLTSP